MLLHYVLNIVQISTSKHLSSDAQMLNILCTIHTAQCSVNGSDIIVYKQRWTVSDTDDDRVSAHMHLYRP